MAGSTLLGFSSLSEKIRPDIRTIGLFICLLLLHTLSIENMEEKALADSDDTDFGGAWDVDLLERS